MHDHQIFVARDSNPPPVLRIPMRRSDQTLALIDHTTANMQIRYFDPLLSTYTQYLSNSGDVQAITTLGTYQAPSTNKVRMDPIGSTGTGGFIEIHLETVKFSTAAKYFHLTVHVDGDDPIAATLRVDLELNGSVHGNVTGSVVGSVGSIGSSGILLTSIDPNLGLTPIRNAAATGGTVNYLDLDVGASGTADFYKGCYIKLISGSASPLGRICSRYDTSGGLKRAYFRRPLPISAAAGNTFSILDGDLLSSGGVAYL